MHQRIEHSLEPDRARAVARAAAEHYASRFARYAPDIRWKDDDHASLSFSAKGVKIAGDLALVPGAIEVELKVPLLLRAFSGKAREVVERELRSWTERAERGEI